jgi:hypothetical protein
VKTRLFCLIALAASVASAEDIKTVNGKEYKNAVVARVEPDGIVIKFSAGIVNLGCTDLPAEAQKKYGCDPAATALRASEEKKLAEKKEAEEKERLRATQKVGDLDQPAVKKPTIRSEAERGFNASLSSTSVSRLSTGSALGTQCWIAMFKLIRTRSPSEWV